MLPIGFTDHLLLLCHVFIQNILSPSAHWHFNSVAVDKSFRDAFSYLWTDFRQEDNDFTCLRQCWDYGNVQIKLFCQQHTHHTSHFQLLQSSGDSDSWKKFVSPQEIRDVWESSRPKRQL